MASKSHEQLLQEITSALPSGGVPGLTTAKGVRNVLTSLVDELVALRHMPTDAASTPDVHLPRPCLQIRYGGIHNSEPLVTRNHLRLSFGGPLSHEMLQADPEIWLFTYNQRRNRHRRSVGWGHPSHQDGWRSANGFWGGRGLWSVDTEFYGDTYLHTLQAAAPYADIYLDGNQWFQPAPGGAAQAKGKKGNNYRFRFALVINAPATQSTPSGKLISELSDEIWFSSSQPDQVFFRAGMYNKMEMN